jgi:hypothetical protein
MTIAASTREKEVRKASDLKTKDTEGHDQTYHNRCAPPRAFQKGAFCCARSTTAHFIAKIVDFRDFTSRFE